MGKPPGGTGLLRGWVAIFLAIAVMGLYGWLMDSPEAQDGVENRPPEPAESDRVVSEFKQPPPTTEPKQKPAPSEVDPRLPQEEDQVSEVPMVETPPEQDPLTTPVPGHTGDPPNVPEPVTTFQTSMESNTEPREPEPEVEPGNDHNTFLMPNANPCALFQAGEIVDWGPPKQGNGIVIRARGVTEIRAAASGKIVKLHQGPIRGKTLFQITEDGQFRLEYGHLGSVKEGRTEGGSITCGEVFATLVPASGSDIVQVHFAVYKIEPGKDWWAASQAEDPETWLNLQPDEL